MLLKINLKYIEEDRDKSKIETRNNIALYLFGIKVKKIKIARTIHGKEKSNKLVNNSFMIIKQVLRATKNKDLLKIGNKIIKTIKVEKLNLKLGINLQDPIANAYSIALINALLPTYLAKQQIALDNLKYETFIANKVIYIDVYTSIQFPILKNIINILKIIFIVIKENKKPR